MNIKILQLLCFYFVSIIFSSMIMSQTNHIDKPPNYNYTSLDSLYSDTSPLKPDYRNHKNIPEYDPSLMPLNYNGKTTTGVWTELNPKVPRVTYFGIHFVNTDTGWAVGANGAIIKTADGGKNWKTIPTTLTTPLLKVRSYNGEIVIASGYDGLILRSTDGGETFTEIATGLGNIDDLWGLEIINDSLGWACGANKLIKTMDGGASWQLVNTPGYTGNLWWIEFMNESYGFIAADGKVLRTTDSGNSWAIIQAGDNAPLYSIDVIDSLHIAAAGYGGTSYRGKNIYSSDGGNTWFNGGDLTYEPVNDIKYINRDTGYVIMNNIIGWKTTNRGQSWTGIGIGGEYEMQFIENNYPGYSAGTGLRIYKTENGYENWERLIINDNFSDVFFVKEEVGLAISSSLNSSYAALYKTNNSGNSWEKVSNSPSGSELFFIDSLTGFIGNYSIFKTTNGGEKWFTVNIPITGEVRKIFFIDSTTGWAVSQWSSSAKGKILKTTDQGENWLEQILAPGSDSYTNIFFKDSLNGWATSRFVWQTTNGGMNWIQRSDIPTFFGTDIFFYENYGFAIEQLKLYKTTNNGISWFTQLNSQYIIRKFGWLSPAHGFIIGDGMYETNDSGDTWNEILELRNIGLRKFQSPKNYLGYSVGNLGLIYRYLDTSIVPVELVSFQGMVENKKVILTWQTASELNNRGFQVEKSFDKENWFSIGFIEGRGTTTEIINYIFIDNNIVTNIQYYRLKQVDHNGQYKFSDIIKIIGNSLITTFQLYPSYPNPFNSSTVISYQVPHRSFINISLYNVIGEKVLEIVNEEKSERLHKELFQSSLLPSGVYFVRMTTNSGFNAVNKITLIK